MVEQNNTLLQRSCSYFTINAVVNDGEVDNVNNVDNNDDENDADKFLWIIIMRFDVINVWIIQMRLDIGVSSKFKGKFVSAADIWF